MIDGHLTPPEVSGIIRRLLAGSVNQNSFLNAMLLRGVVIIPPALLNFKR